MGFTIVPPESSGSSLRSSPSTTENLQRVASRRHPNQMIEPPQQFPFEADEQWLYFKLPRDNRVPTFLQTRTAVLLSLPFSIPLSLMKKPSRYLNFSSSE